MSARAGGRLIGVGVGPGAPDLLTLRAARLIENAGHVAYITAHKGQSMARRIAAGFISADASELEFVMPMKAGQGVRDDGYDRAAALIRPLLGAGEDVVFLCEGDPLFYGSFIYLMQRLGGEFEVLAVPGVSSPMAAAAAAPLALTLRNEVLTMLPATLPEAELRVGLKMADTVVIMKLGRHFGKVRALLEELGLADRTAYVAAASTPRQHVCALKDAPSDAPYFALLIVCKRGLSL